MIDGVTEQALLRKTLRGDGAAFGRLVEEYQRPLFNTAYRMLGDLEEARDLTQTAFVKAFEKLGTYDSRYRFFSWIYKILVNEGRNWLRRRQGVEPLLEDFASEGKTLEEEHDDRRRGERIQSAISHLAPDYRLVITLKYFGDLSYREMSEVLDLPEKTVKSRLFTARRRLAEVLIQLGVRT
jgi:RNA polymerase sigma-70 factor (ECF subfamily)